MSEALNVMKNPIMSAVFVFIVITVSACSKSPQADSGGKGKDLEAVTARYFYLQEMPTNHPESFSVSGEIVPMTGGKSVVSPESKGAPIFWLDLPIPDDSETVSVWFKGQANDKLLFRFRDQNARFQIKEEREEGSPDPYRPNYTEATARLKDWSLRTVRLSASHPGLVLESVQATGKTPGKRYISLPRIGYERRSGEASWIWKLKDFDPMKPSSIAWTGVNYFEYGWDRSAFLRPVAWREALPHVPVAGLKIVIRTTEGKSLWEKILGGAELAAEVELPRLPEGCYFVECSGTDADGNAVGQGRLVYQILRDDANPAAVSDQLPVDVRRENSLKQSDVGTKDHGVFSLSMMATHFDPLLERRLPTSSLPDLVDWTARGGMTPGMIVSWNELEPAPGEYRWDLLDGLISLTQKHGMFTWLGVGFSGDGVPEWMWFDELMDQNQLTIRSGYHYVSPFGTRFQREQRKMLIRLLTHYKGNANVEGYIIYAGASEGFLTDSVDSISDYSPPAKKAFRIYLKEIYQSDLQALNSAWGQSYDAWDDVHPPMPDWSREWECSAAWMDFHRFKADFVVKRLTDLTTLVRTIDADRPMMMYAKEGFGSTGRLAQVFKNSNFRYTNGGGETEASYVQTCVMRNHGVTANPEGHFVMPHIGSVAMVIANSLWAGNFEGQDIMWGLVWAKMPLKIPEYEEMVQLTKSVEEHQAELNEAVPIQPWAGYFDGVQSMLQTRSFRTGLYPEVTEMMRASGSRMHNLCSWVDDESSLEAMASYRVIVDAGSKVLSAESMKTLLSYVKGGGVLVASTDTASYLTGEAAPSHALAKALGAESVVKVGGWISDAGQKLALKSLNKITWKSGIQAGLLKSDLQGRPLLWEIPLGKGKVLMASGKIDFVKSVPFLQEVIGNTTQTTIPYRCEATNMTVRPLRGKHADYLPLVFRTPDQGLPALNHTMEELRKMPEGTLKVSGIPAGVNEVEEILSGRTFKVNAGSLEGSFIPGMVYILKIPRDS